MDIDPDELDESTMTWREAEYLAAEHMRALGFEDAEVTPLGADQGLDVVAGGGVAQVKHFSAAPVGSPDIQRLKGAGHQSSRALFYALNGYTSAARAYARDAGVALFTYSQDRRITPVNQLAIDLEGAGYFPVDFGTSTTARDRVVSELNAYAQSTADSGARLMNGIKAVTSDPKWVDLLTQEKYVETVQPAIAEINRFLEMLKTVDGEHPVGEVMSTIVQCEALAQKIASRFDLDYSNFMLGGAGQRPTG